jgi:hypothetical protein
MQSSQQPLQCCRVHMLKGGRAVTGTPQSLQKLVVHVF